jgi:hypothetical protein
MPAPHGFAWTSRKNGDVVITHHGLPATVLRGSRATRFLEQVQHGDAQQLMARATGNYKRGNERSDGTRVRGRIDT